MFVIVLKLCPRLANTYCSRKKNCACVKAIWTPPQVIFSRFEIGVMKLLRLSHFLPHLKYQDKICDYWNAFNEAFSFVTVATDVRPSVSATLDSFFIGRNRKGGGGGGGGGRGEPPLFHGLWVCSWTNLVSIQQGFLTIASKHEMNDKFSYWCLLQLWRWR